ncbi:MULTISPECIES: winged helix-turn-helix transcriptional regulator [Micromonospora]|uniref:HxlR family transcriptional regulator n=1 Tax=Micromonospora solifontis TaxID=2487138 RepID=A0ABX9WHX9_9ACTN|nr:MULTISPECIES: winged helix-turn-helix transcriptional regulator [Micromonospora]NES13148.1 redoxin domain-containing protein [Micromonospora sp. PPF5-17B]NES36287.1 redoxin domain-containing protein [Micromonospora solifontis]NES55073.1 redoxin domain-containing protein [Micromonospora sp. PPF5-6]RNL99693.1 HxlR family transcriptional regulator [Micromonospora solifontis]
MRRADLGDADCGIAQALGVLGDWWTFLIVREIAGGTTRFDAVQRELGVSRRALTERLAGLVEHGVLVRRPYSTRPPRHDYLLTAKGEALLPVLVALQDWGTRHVMGDGTLTATATAGSAEARRMHHLVGRRLPELVLARDDGGSEPPAVPDRWTVLYLFPGAFAPGTQGVPPGWGEIPGAVGCTLESRTYADRHDRFRALGAEVRGVSTQRPDQLRAFAAHARLPYPLLSDQDGRLAAGLLLPTFRAGGVDRLKRLTLLVDPRAVVRAVQFPVTDPAGSVDEMLDEVRRRTVS